MLDVRTVLVAIFCSNFVIILILFIWSEDYIDCEVLYKAIELFTVDGKLVTSPEIDLSPSYQPLLEDVKEPDGHLSRI